MEKDTITSCNGKPPRKKKSDFPSFEAWTEFDRARERGYDAKRRASKKEFEKTTTLEQRREQRVKQKAIIKSAKKDPTIQVDRSIDTLMSLMDGLYHSSSMTVESQAELKAAIVERLKSST